MGTFKRFEDIKTWQQARILNKKNYSITSRSPFDKDYKFRSQIESASGSIMDNIAEGFGRGGNHEFANFLCYSRGSAAEVQSQTYRALDKGYISQEEFDDLYKDADEIIGMLTNFIKYLRGSDFKGPMRRTDRT